MKTTEILKGKSRHMFSGLFKTMHPRKGLLVITAGALLALGTAFKADARYLIEPRICFDKTVFLLTAPLTAEQRQALHAQNFTNSRPNCDPFTSMSSPTPWASWWLQAGKCRIRRCWGSIS